MDGGAKASRARPRKQVFIALHVIAELEPMNFWTGQVDADAAAVTILSRLPHQDLVELIGELAGQTEDEARADAVGQAGPLHAPQRRRNNVVEVALAAQVALHRVEPE